MEIIGIGILFMIGVYLAPFIIGVVAMAIVGLISLFPSK